MTTPENSETATATSSAEGEAATAAAEAPEGGAEAAAADESGVEPPSSGNGAPERGGDDDEDRPNLVDDCDDLVADIQSAKERVKGKSALYERRAGGSSKFVVATRDLIADEVLDLMKQAVSLMADLAEDQERMQGAIGALAVDVATQSRTLYAITTGTSIHWANLLAQRVLASQQTDPAITSLAQAVLDSMRAVHELTQTGAVREMTPQAQPPMSVPTDSGAQAPAPQTAG